MNKHTRRLLGHVLVLFTLAMSLGAAEGSAVGAIIRRVLETITCELEPMICTDDLRLALVPAIAYVARGVLTFLFRHYSRGDEDSHPRG